MPKKSRYALVVFAVTTLTVGAIEVLAAEDESTETPVSAYAPAPVLIEQLEEFQAEFEEIVADPDEYASKAGRIARHGHAMAVIALALALHDEDHTLKDSAADVLAAVQEAAATEDLDAAQQAVAEIRRAMNGSGAAETPDSWRVVAPMGMLMKQVSFMHTRMGRGARGRRFESRADEFGRSAALIAIIGQHTALDTHEVENKADVPRWVELCAEMRDQSGQVSAAFLAKDQAEVQAALGRLEKSCNACHEEFRVEI